MKKRERERAAFVRENERGRGNKVGSKNERESKNEVGSKNEIE